MRASVPETRSCADAGAQDSRHPPRPVKSNNVFLSISVVAEREEDRHAFCCYLKHAASIRG